MQSLRQDFELMCLNALVFNKEGDEYWREAMAFEAKGQAIFKTLKRKTQVRNDLTADCLPSDCTQWGRIS
jgi:hypothetical protein